MVLDAISVVGDVGAIIKISTIPVKGVLKNANWAQNSIRKSESFSREGIEIYSKKAGYTIRTVDDLANAIRKGDIKPKEIPLDYVINKNGTKLILNTRTSVALERAGIPKNKWYGQNKTGKTAYYDGKGAQVTFDDLAKNQLKTNKLPIDGSNTAP